MKQPGRGKATYRRPIQRRNKHYILGNILNWPTSRISGSASALRLVARATTLTSALYASLAWWGYASSWIRKKLEVLVNRMKRRGFLHPEDPTTNDLASKADEALFRTFCTYPAQNNISII